MPWLSPIPFALTLSTSGKELPEFSREIVMA
jgi:hypothetical protein